ncbi:DUF479 domain-containing protein [Flaviaesturariibacter flavus]|uniref:DUF479 domain-containing protein n=1 Tax=Flaviaesturariibacter flavus TaxID=2502780 RepID=A0A4R1B9G1_9BACT|nr:ACP phosphodiesterase [Flaviaesturariibacter flavus]TCJ13545.1 DUF479 domain-containing protein [Flaviaesturariibacter flavus]
MNYLAHAWLSFGNTEVLVGNMIADFVKGKARYAFPAGIRAGIELHRRIDEFTDTHAATAMAKEYFRPHYRLYAAPIVDVVYDHFLAADTGIHTDAALLAFSEDVYRRLHSQAEWLPPRFAAMLPHMEQNNWLYHYKERDGLTRSLGGLFRRAVYMPPVHFAEAIVDAHYAELRHCYTLIVGPVKDFAKAELQRILT